MRKTAITIVLTVCVALPAYGIIIRHDRKDAKYEKLGQEFRAAVSILPDGSGVLIAPEWVLTAAHVGRGVRDRSPKIEIDGRRIAVKRVLIHPEWADMAAHDIALLELAEPVRDVRPARLYADSDEVGRIVTFVGRGDFGTGLTGPQSMDRKKRGATNRVEDADADWLYFTFDEPPKATKLEGVSGPGDSGGPALLERDGELFTLGVSVYCDGKGCPGHYGIREAYTQYVRRGGRQ